MKNLATITTLRVFRRNVRELTSTLSEQESGLIQPILNDLIHVSIVFVRGILGKLIDDYYTIRKQDLNFSGTAPIFVATLANLDITNVHKIKLFHDTLKEIGMVRAQEFNATRTLYTPLEISATAGIVTFSLMQIEKSPVRVATTANVTLSGEQTIDGISVVAGDRVLVKNQTTAADNGIYVVSAGSWSRATDADTSAEVKSAMFVRVNEGTVNGSTGWLLTTDDPIILGTTALTFIATAGTPEVPVLVLYSGIATAPTNVEIWFPRNPKKVVDEEDTMDIPEAYIPIAQFFSASSVLKNIGKGVPPEIENPIKEFINAHIGQLGLKVTPQGN